VISLSEQQMDVKDLTI